MSGQSGSSQSSLARPDHKSGNVHLKEVIKMNIPNIELGKAGELRVASELILRGFNPALVLVDNGCDIVLESGIRIQVKTCATLSRNKTYNRKNKRYIFSLARGNSKKKYTNEADYFICWCVPEDWFQVIPAKEAIKRNCWSMYEKPNSNWEVLWEGSSS
jgi:hypothetical protein